MNGETNEVMVFVDCGVCMVGLTRSYHIPIKVTPF